MKQYYMLRQAIAASVMRNCYFVGAGEYFMFYCGSPVISGTFYKVGE